MAEPEPTTPTVGATVAMLGIQVSCLGFDQGLAELGRRVESGTRTVAAFANAFCVTQAQRDACFRAALTAADFVFADGMPLVWASRFLGTRGAERVSGPDFFVAFNRRAAERGWSVYFLAGGERNAERAAEHFKSAHPSLRVVGAWSPPYGPIDEALNDALLADIALRRPDVLWVGLGAPRQELWLQRNRGRLMATVTLAVGGAFEYASGARRRAPPWMQRRGLEWLYRVSQDWRLFVGKRYYAYPREFFLPVLLDGLGRLRARQPAGRAAALPGAGSDAAAEPSASAPRFTIARAMYSAIARWQRTFGWWS